MKLDPADVVTEMKQAGMEYNTIALVQELIDTCRWASELFARSEYPGSAAACRSIAELAEGEDKEP